jgi:invasion protein IalB
MLPARPAKSSLAVLLAAALATAALPAAAESLGTFKDWTAHKLEVEGQTLCFMESRPTQLAAKPAGRDPALVRVTITHRPARSIRHALVFETGYPVEAGVLAELDIDGNPYAMGTDAAGYFYVTKPEDERKLLDAMKGGLKLTAKGVTTDGTPVADLYSLSGFTAAMNAIDKACPE